MKPLANPAFLTESRTECDSVVMGQWSSKSFLVTSTLTAIKRPSPLFVDAKQNSTGDVGKVCLHLVLYLGRDCAFIRVHSTLVYRCMHVLAFTSPTDILIFCEAA